MTDEQSTEMTEDQIMEGLRKKADMLKITYHPKIGKDKLVAKINAKLNDEPDPTDDEDEPPVTATTKKRVAPVAETQAQMRGRLRKEANALIRVEITCMNPEKRSSKGEIIGVSNSVIGTIKKFIQFNEPYHVPRAILGVLETRKFQTLIDIKDHLGRKTKKAKQVNEFGIKYLDPLTPKELEALARKQALAGSIDQD